MRWASPLFATDPGAAAGATALDSRVQQLANGPALLAFDANADGLFETPIVTRFDVNGTPASPTLDLTNAIELRGAGANLGKAPVGAAGSFNPPSLLGLAGTAPYGHHGRAATVEAVFETIASGGLGHPTFGASAQQLLDLRAFLLSVDGTTAPVQQ